MKSYAQLMAIEITQVIEIYVKDEPFTVESLKKIKQILFELPFIKCFKTYKTTAFYENDIVIVIRPLQ